MTAGRTQRARDAGAVEDRSAPPLPALDAGRIVGDFRLVELLGQGGMGQVWAAEQLALRRRVAVKLVRPELVTAHHLELFAREARAGGRLSHPGLVAVHAHGEADGLAWIAMELVPGARTLRDLIDELARRPDVPEGHDRRVAELVAEIAEAMQAAHSAGVIHRDLKPQNVLLGADDRPKVGDFGLARLTDEAALSVTGDFAGTYLYMSPEQALAKRIGLDHRTDVFSLGVVLYELLTLRRPFGGDTAHQITEQIVFHEPPDPRLVRSKIPRDLVVVTSKALEKERERRYASMLELAADLRRFLADEPIHARPPTRPERLRRWVKRHPGRSSAAAIASVTFAVIALLLASNVRTNRALTSERSNLAQANQALEAKSIESEGRRIVAEQNEQRARDEKERADREAGVATKKADEVLRLAALQTLEDLIHEADRMWPAHPANIERYERWLDRAQALVEEFPRHEAKLAELRRKARPWSSEEQMEHRSQHPRARDLDRVTRELAFVRARRALLAGGAPGPEPTAAEAGVNFEFLPTYGAGLNEFAWQIVAPERRTFGEEKEGLVLARRAVELAGESPCAASRDTLAWALFALGRFDEAMAAEERALEEAGAEQKAEFEGNVQKLRAAIEAERGPGAAEEAEQRVAELEGELAAIESELSTRPEWSFDGDQDKWWHSQLEKLVKGIAVFANAETGLFSEGTSPEYGWGVKKRLENAKRLREEFAPAGEQARAWEAALSQIRAAYPALDLTPQIGLTPIGQDPVSKLWEFAHPETGAPAVRGADGRLVLTEATGLVFVLLPAGTFQMGAQYSAPNGPNYDPQAQDNEGPVHPVTVSAFFLSKFEMTQGQWLRCAGSNPSRDNPEAYDRAYNRERRPGDLLHAVEQVSWSDSAELLERLGLSLPSEAQWEYGARAGTSSVWWTGDTRESLAGTANLADSYAVDNGASNWVEIEAWLDDGNTSHARVGGYRANAFGLHDVHGNVWEWCQDGYDGGLYRRGAIKDPLTPPEDASGRAYRGGGFASVATKARSAFRSSAPTTFAVRYQGLRPVRAIVP